MHFKQVIPKKHSHSQHPQQLHFFKKQTDLILLSRNQQEDCLVLFIMASLAMSVDYLKARYSKV